MKKNLLRVCPYIHLLSIHFLLLVLCNTGVKAQTTGASIFRDDFNGEIIGGLWQTPTSWTIADQSAYFFDGGDRWLRTNTSYPQTSYIIETAAKGFTVNYYRSFKITFGQEEASNQKMYVLTYQPYFGGILSLGISTDNFYYPQVLDEAVLYPIISVDQWCRFKIARYQSGLIQVFVDRGSGYGTIPFLEAIDNTYTKLGHVAWREDTETYAESFYVDWMEVFQPSVEKPAIKEKPVEDDLVTQVSAESGRSYNVTKLATGIKPYTDRDYTITAFPSYLAGASFLRTAMDDKWNNSDSFLTSFIKRDAIIYVGYDPRAKTIPDWLNDWTKTGERIELTDPGTSYVDVYSKLVEFWEIYPRPFILGGNLASPATGAKMNYFFAAVERPSTKIYEAEMATFSGAKIATNHAGYSGTGFIDYINAANDYIEWDVTIDIPGTYNLGFVYSNGSKASRTLQIMVDGSVLTDRDFLPSFSWNSWAFTNGPNVFLTKGNHKVRTTATGTSGPNMDYLSLSYQTTAPPVNYPAVKVSRDATGPAMMAKENAMPVSAVAYPNPFRSNATISYEVTEKNRVRLSLLSAQGQALQWLVDEVKEPGKYTVNIDGSKLPAGIYFYRLQTGSKNKFGRIIKQ